MLTQAGPPGNPPLPHVFKCPARHISYEIWPPWLHLWAIWLLAMKHAKIWVCFMSVLYWTNLHEVIWVLWYGLHSKKHTTCSGLMKTALNNVVLPTLFNVVNNIVQHCWAWISPQSGATILNNIVDNIEQCGQHNIVQGCFHQPWTGCAFLRV